jgi:flavorubredoxin
VMEPRIDEIAERIYRISTFVPAAAIPPHGFTFNQFLVDADEPLLYHTGMRELFPLVSGAVDRIVGLDRLRWIAFSHIEADESGAMNEFLAACPRAEVIHGATGVELSIADMANRRPRTWGPGEALELGDHTLRRRVLQFDTPHVPHNWEAQLIFEEETGTLFTGDLGTQLGDPPALTGEDIIEGAVEAERLFRQTSSLTAYVATLRRLADLAPRTLAIMHGSSFAGDGAALLKRLATAYEQEFTELGFATEPPGVAELA